MLLRRSVSLAVFFYLGSALAGPQESTRPDPPTSSSNTQQRQVEHGRNLPVAMFLEGSVVMDDGSALPSGLRVELKCNQQVNRQVFLHREGRFSFEMNDPDDLSWADASVGRADIYMSSDSSSNSLQRGANRQSRTLSTGVKRLSGCQVRTVALPGFESKPVHVNDSRASWNTDVGIIVLKRLEGVTGSTVSITTLKAPKKAREAYDKANKELGKKKINHKKVQKELEKAVEIYPGFAAAWHLIGLNQLAQKNKPNARTSFQRAIDTDEKYVKPYLELARLEIKEHKWHEALKLTSKVNLLNPYIIENQYFHGMANYYLVQFEAAEESFRRLEKNDQLRTYPLVNFYLGMIDAKQGEIQTSARELRQYLSDAPEELIPEDWRKLIEEQLDIWEKQGLIEKEDVT